MFPIKLSTFLLFLSISANFFFCHAFCRVVWMGKRSGAWASSVRALFAIHCFSPFTVSASVALYSRCGRASLCAFVCASARKKNFSLCASIFFRKRTKFDFRSAKKKFFLLCASIFAFSWKRTTFFFENAQNAICEAHKKKFFSVRLNFFSESAQKKSFFSARFLKTTGAHHKIALERFLCFG